MSVWTAPDSLPLNLGWRSLFLAGGITGCPDWQTAACGGLAFTGYTLLNPRRPNFPMDDPHAGKIQISWEHIAMRRADKILFWFPCETLCPITLYELGAWSMTDKPLFVGTHPMYVRRFDVLEQTRLARPEIKVASGLDELLTQVREDARAR